MFYVVILNKFFCGMEEGNSNLFLQNNQIIRNKKIELEILIDFFFWSLKKYENERKKWIYCFNFIYIEFDYQNSGYSYDLMGQVYLFFFLLIFNLIFIIDLIGFL